MMNIRSLSTDGWHCPRRRDEGRARPRSFRGFPSGFHEERIFGFHQAFAPFLPGKRLWIDPSRPEGRPFSGIQGFRCASMFPNITVKRSCQ
jgi:hypothetical protein